MFQRRTVVSLFFLASGASCLAAEPGIQSQAAGAVVEACIASATTNAPVDATALTAFFKSNKAGDKLTANADLPKIKLNIDNAGTFRCVVMAKAPAQDSEFAKALVEKLKAWPGIQPKTLSDGTESYIVAEQPEKKLLGTAITVEMVYGNVWTVMVWGTKPEAAK